MVERAAKELSVVAKALIPVLGDQKLINLCELQKSQGYVKRPCHKTKPSKTKQKQAKRSFYELKRWLGC